MKVYIVECRWLTCDESGSHILGVVSNLENAEELKKQHEKEHNHPRCRGHSYEYCNIEEYEVIDSVQ